ncbi:glycoside hydrolase family 2 protein [Brachybacterium sp. J153]|uniref:glycoside hydrolase family 2 protein n=1 Tax=Brachybacterium sp. J153 TaxID=3116488 RepID=UPI002E764D50|nr:sugar-binding domain-containing protein [Brachybacterium sp. J153]MEE1619463.1 sugar-binding domain-containing protein [Brachybacterium sp. J153]
MPDQNPTLPESLSALFARADELAAQLDAPLSAAADVPRPEHPRPQLQRSAWLSLNGTWQFEIDRSDTGRERGLLDAELATTITVPFAPETAASGIGDRDFLEAVWYRRTVAIPADWDGLRPILRFEAVDQDATVWANGVEVARHRGGFTPFAADLSQVPGVGASSEVTVVVRARDPHDQPQARGKQSTWFRPTHANYHRTTGIWQSVWLEGVPVDEIRSLRILPSLAAASFAIDVPLSRSTPGTTLEVIASVPGGGAVARTSVRADLDLAPHLSLTIPSEHVRVWGPGAPELYALQVRLLDAAGGVLDEVRSYAGLRSTSLNAHEYRLNGEKVFQRLVLDQGYWEETFMTTPTDSAFTTDIRLAMEAGFNGARLHQKVFEQRMLFWADLHGYLTWGEFGDWGVSGLGPLGDNQQPTASFIGQWIEAVSRDINHPSIIGWCPLNETHQILHDRYTQLDTVTQAMYDATKLADPSRPVLDASGYSHRVRGADVYDSHSYEQDPERFRVEQSGLAEGRPFANRRDLAPDEYPFADGEFSLPFAGQPYFVSEYGGIWWNEQEAREAAEAERAGNNAAESWGYGQRIASEAELYERFEGLTRVLLEDPLMFGYCYTQMTDVFQEKNGIVDFARGRKLDLARLRAVQEKTAAYEAD